MLGDDNIKDMPVNRDIMSGDETKGTGQLVNFTQTQIEEKENLHCTTKNHTNIDRKSSEGK